VDKSFPEFSDGIGGFCQIRGQPEKIQPVTIKKIRQNIRKFPKLFFIIFAILLSYQIKTENKSPNIENPP